MTTSAPLYALRRDLIVVEQRDAGKLYVVLKDPSTGKVFGVNGPSFRILQALDGKTTLDAIAQKVGGPAAGDAPVARVTAFVARAAEWGILTRAQTEEEAQSGKPANDASPEPSLSPVRRFLRRYNPFYLRFRVANPTSVLRPLTPVFFPLFTRGALAVLAVAIVAAIVMITRDTRYLVNSFLVFGFFGSWLLLYVLLFVTTVLHETAHAMACMRYGGEVREMGVMVYFFRPGFYTDVSDAWLMPSRTKRIIIALAGVYVEAFAWCIAVAMWRLAPPFSAAAQLGFVLATVLLGRILVNLIPFFRLDGYFVLSDLLGVRNLRPKAFAYLVSLLPAVGRPFRAEREASLRERAILIGYGVTSVAFLALAIGETALQAHRGLRAWSPSYGGAIFVVLALVLGVTGVLVAYDSLSAQRAMIAGRPRRRLFGG